jgi:hypothetical protein
MIDAVQPGADWPGVEHVWWYNPLNPRSLRLTQRGFDHAHKNSKLPYWTVALDAKILPKQLLQLERCFASPYFIRNLKTLEVFDDRDAVMIQLHAGNLVQYLNNQM